MTWRRAVKAGVLPLKVGVAVLFQPGDLAADLAQLGAGQHGGRHPG